MNTIEAFDKESILILDYGKYGTYKFKISYDDNVVIVLNVPHQRPASAEVYLSEDDFIDAMLNWSSDKDTSEMSDEIEGSREWANEIALDDLASGSMVLSMEDAMAYIRSERPHDTKIVNAMEEFGLLEVI